MKKYLEDFWLLFENLEEGAALHEIILDKKGIPCNYRFLHVNSAFEKITRLQDVVGKTALDVIPDLEQSWIDQYGKVAIQNETTSFENYSTSLNKWFKIKTYCPKKGYFLTVFDDITKTKQKESDLDSLITSITNLVLEVDKNGKFINLWINDESKLFLPKNQLLGNTIEETMGKQFSDVVFSMMEKSFYEPAFFEYPTPNNDQEWWKATISPIYHENLFSGNFVISVKDVSEIKRQRNIIAETTKNLYEQQIIYKLLVENMTDIVAHHNINGDCIFISPSVTNVLGYAPEELLGQKLFEIIYPEDMPKIQDAMQNLFNPDYDSPFIEYRVINKKGETCWIEAFATPINIGDVSFISSGKVVNKRKKIEEDLMIAKQKAEESDQLKSAFLANMSHEIRTPLNAIIGFSSLIEENLHNCEIIAQYANIIINAGDSLNTLINDIIDLSKIQANQLNISKSDCKIGPFILSVFEIIKALNKKGLFINYIIGDGLSESIVELDKTRVQQIILNLVNNSLKFTDTGSIQIGCGINPKVDNELLFWVKDTGIGISQDKKEAIFNRFVRLENQNTKVNNGAGLGLSIVKGLIELMGGNVWVESVLDSGSTFYFTIPYTSSNIKQTFATSVKVDSLSEALVLIVEDNIHNNFLLEEMLKKHTKLLSCYTATEALNLFKNNDVDLVLLDIELPDMSGYDVIKLFKEQKAHIPVIAQTAYAMSSDREKALDSGFDDYISKPIKANILLEMINRLLLKH
jgi:PAS domain S-box-containing protein